MLLIWIKYLSPCHVPSHLYYSVSRYNADVDPEQLVGHLKYHYQIAAGLQHIKYGNIRRHILRAQYYRASKSVQVVCCPTFNLIDIYPECWWSAPSSALHILIYYTVPDFDLWPYLRYESGELDSRTSFAKSTCRNIKETGEYVWNMATYDLQEAMNKTTANLIGTNLGWQDWRRNLVNWSKRGGSKKAQFNSNVSFTQVCTYLDPLSWVTWMSLLEGS